jgi:pyruvate,water dikinase
MASTPLATAFVAPFDTLRMTDVEAVGGKNASLGEMISQLSESGVRVPGGFATTAHAFRTFLAEAAWRGASPTGSRRSTPTTCARSPTPAPRSALDRGPAAAAGVRGRGAARVRAARRRAPDATFAVRSSATAEDLPEASFAGQQETFLNVAGIDGVLASMREVFASLYNDRAISYRVHKGYAHGDVALSVGVQRMVRSDVGAGRRDVHDRHRERLSRRRLHHLELRPRRDGRAGRRQPRRVLRPQAGAEERQAGDHPQEPRLEADPDGVRLGRGSRRERQARDDARHRDRAAQPLLALDDDVAELARYALVIEQHYGRPMDIEWGKDGVDGKLYILQARPETVKSQAAGKAEQRYDLKGSGTVLVEGRAIGQKIGTGPVRIVESVADMDRSRPATSSSPT